MSSTEQRGPLVYFSDEGPIVFRNWQAAESWLEPWSVRLDPNRLAYDLDGKAYHFSVVPFERRFLWYRTIDERVKVLPGSGTGVREESVREIAVDYLLENDSPTTREALAELSMSQLLARIVAVCSEIHE